MNDLTKHSRSSRPAKSKLSESQQLLISRFCDGECSYLSNFFAKRLLAKNAAARELLTELEDLKNSCGELFKEREEIKVDLWGQIETRIEQEERASLYLGERRIKETRPSFIERFDLRHALFGGVSGAAVAAALLLTVNSRPADIVTFSAPSAGLLSSSGIIQPAGVNTNNAPTSASRYQISNRAPRKPLEVDWMRANGSLSLIPDPNGSSAIIWVRRRPSQYAPSRLVAPTPLLNQPLNKQNRLDETAISGAK